MNGNETYDVIVIGGGAAGLAAAIAAAWRSCMLQAGCATGFSSAAAANAKGKVAANANGKAVPAGVDSAAGMSGAAHVDSAAGAVAASDDVAGADVFLPLLRVAVFEADERVGRSILATGNGRCNFSNSHIDLGFYRNSSFVECVLTSLERLAFWPQGASGAAAGAAIAAPAARNAGINSDEADGGYAGCVTADGARCNANVAGDDNAVLDFFFNMGLCWREEGQGRLFPLTGKASTVLDVLRAAAASLGVEERCNMQVRCVEPPRAPGKPYTLRMADGSFQRARAVVCAVGGSVAQGFLPNDLEFYAPLPVLGPLKTETQHVRALDNIRVRCTATLERQGAFVAAERGEVLFRKYGLSGIAIFNLSRYAQPGDAVVLDLLPDVPQANICAFLETRARRMAQLRMLGAAVQFKDENDTAGQQTAARWEAGKCPAEQLTPARNSARQHSMQLRQKAQCSTLRGGIAFVTCDDVLRGLLLPLVAEAVLKRAGIKPTDKATPENLRWVAQNIKRFSATVEGVGDAKQCQVHRGGFSCSEFEPTTMECKRYAGLFAAGEMLDVDAACGGYNLHWAWASGLVAGASAAIFLENKRKAR